MANPEQLKILRQGVQHWNEWREANPHTYIDLRETNLNGADLRGVNFSEVDVGRAQFEEANLSGANLRRANLDPLGEPKVHNSVKFHAAMIPFSMKSSSVRSMDRHDAARGLRAAMSSGSLGSSTLRPGVSTRL